MPKRKKTIRDSRGRRGPASGAISATDAQNNFGDVLRRVAEEGVVHITKYDRETAVVLSAKRYRELMGEFSELDELERQFDELTAGMQTERAAAAADALFEMDSRDLGAAAVRAATARAATPRDD